MGATVVTSESCRWRSVAFDLESPLVVYLRVSGVAVCEVFGGGVLGVLPPAKNGSLYLKGKHPIGDIPIFH